MNQPGIGTARLYRNRADFSGARLDLRDDQRERITGLVAELYGDASADGIVDGIERILRYHHAHKTPELLELEQTFDLDERFSEQDVMLITYGDVITAENGRGLEVLARFAEEYFHRLITILHILPFYPWSSDRGFSVQSYWLVDRNLGGWEHISRLNDSFRLMFDGVFNHASRHSRWFQEFVADHPDFREFFIAFPSEDAIPPEDAKEILRPRTSPLLTRVDTLHGPRWVWTTFSEDQVDLNFGNPRVFLEILSLLLYYVRRGADLVRLDAVTYLWKELGTSCAHLPQTHACIKLLRAAVDVVDPRIAFVTETNVPHADNVSYFGSGDDEAQMVYNFALPPLVLHTIQTGDATVLSRWASELEPPSPTTHFLNFLASHDGIGLMGARGILSEEEIEAMCRRTREHGGLVSMKSDGDGGESPYELNITWYSAVNREDDGEPLALQVNRFVASRAIALVLKGVPGVYLPSLIGSRNDLEAVERSSRSRDINRTTIDEQALRRILANPASSATLVATRFVRILQARVEEPAFHPRAAARVLHLDPRLFAVLRTSSEGRRIACLISVVPHAISVELDQAEMDGADVVEDILYGQKFRARSGHFEVALPPYGMVWVREMS